MLEQAINELTQQIKILTQLMRDNISQGATLSDDGKIVMTEPTSAPTTPPVTPAPVTPKAEIGVDDLTTVCATAVRKGVDKQAIVDILTKYGAKTVAKLAPEHRQAVYDEVVKL
jgi:hypothetical protein